MVDLIRWVHVTGDYITIHVIASASEAIHLAAARTKKWIASLRSQ
ncbi:hypothetical protein [Bradyrhizobium sp. LMTR 3]|nr:hypothetical protein [Bradyrhizobium sp. LMTR 3]